MPRLDLPLAPNPTTLTDYNIYTPHSSKSITNPDIPDIEVDASYAGDTQYTKSVTGIIARLSGGTILCKIKFQDVVALSSTEAEFITASDQYLMISVLNKKTPPSYTMIIMESLL